MLQYAINGYIMSLSICEAKLMHVLIMLTSTAKFNADTDTSIEKLVCSAWVIFAEGHICLCMHEHVCEERRWAWRFRGWDLTNNACDFCT